jgi:quercetin dioxygenase-like cupin family protein
VRFVAAGEDEVVGDARDRRVEILSDDDSVHATWSRFAPGRDGADLHVHRRHSDLFYVLEGELTVRLGPEGTGVAVPAGSLARLPPLVVHGFRNAGEHEVRYLNLHAPGRGFAGYMRALRDGSPITYDQHPPPADGGRAASDAVFTADGPVLADIDEIRVAVLRSGAESPEVRVHARHVASFYVLDGELALTIDGRERRARAGAWVQVQPGTEYAIGAVAARFLEIRTPAAGAGAGTRG